MSIYTASRTRHANRWRELRASGIPIISTWIDEAGPGESASMVDLWDRCINEAGAADALILYREDGEELKGAIAETGAALLAGKPVFAVGFDGEGDLKAFSFLNHRLVTRCESVEVALLLAGIRTDDVIDMSPYPTWDDARKRQVLRQLQARVGVDVKLLDALEAADRQRAAKV